MLAPECADSNIDELLLSLGDQLVNFEAEIRRLRDAIVSARWRLAKGKGLWNGPATECDMVLEDALKMHDPVRSYCVDDVRSRLGTGQPAHLRWSTLLALRDVEMTGKVPSARADLAVLSAAHDAALIDRCDHGRTWDQDCDQCCAVWREEQVRNLVKQAAKYGFKLVALP